MEYEVLNETKGKQKIVVKLIPRFGGNMMVIRRKKEGVRVIF